MLVFKCLHKCSMGLRSGDCGGSDSQWHRFFLLESFEVWGVVGVWPCRHCASVPRVRFSLWASGCLVPAHTEWSSYSFISTLHSPPLKGLMFSLIVPNTPSCWFPPTPTVKWAPHSALQPPSRSPMSALKWICSCLLLLHRPLSSQWKTSDIWCRSW